MILNYCFGSFIYGQLSAKNQVSSKILFLGLDNAGKTSFVNTIIEKRNPFKTFKTIGFAKPQQVVIDGHPYLLHELGGSLTFRNAWKKKFLTTQGLVYIIDATDSARFGESLSELKELLALERETVLSLCIVLNTKENGKSNSPLIWAEAKANVLEGLSREDTPVFLFRDKDKVMNTMHAMLKSNERKKSRKKQQTTKQRSSTAKVVPETALPTNKTLCETPVCQFKSSNKEYKPCSNDATIRCADSGWVPLCKECYQELLKRQ